MPKTRNNHYVPQWYQEGFFEPGSNTLAYLDLTPPRKTLNNGRVITERALFTAPTSRAFRQQDLYSTFFGTSINDEIERRLFGDIDARGSLAVRAFAGTDVGEWHRHFQTLFEYIDIQKIRTPKGLDWLKAQYPQLTQNELMIEMQGIRMMHCTLWTEGVREIVSADDAETKFIVSDHPVTIYNHAVSPEMQLSAYAYWLKHEEPYPKNGGVIPTSPRAKLAEARTKLEVPSYETIKNYLNDTRSDIYGIGVRLLVERLQKPKGERLQFFNEVEAGDVPGRVVDRVLASGVRLSVEELTVAERLLVSPDKVVRYCAMTLLSEQYMDAENIQEHAKRMSEDSEPQIRNRALQVRRR